MNRAVVPAESDYLHFHLVGAGPDRALCDGRELDQGDPDPENVRGLPVCGTCWLLAQHIRREARR